MNHDTRLKIAASLRNVANNLSKPVSAVTESELIDQTVQLIGEKLSDNELGNFGPMRDIDGNPVSAQDQVDNVLSQWEDIVRNSRLLKTTITKTFAQAKTMAEEQAHDMHWRPE